jgi:hypothetical protein
LTCDQQVVLKASAQAAQKWEAYLAGGAGLALQLGHRRSVEPPILFKGCQLASLKDIAAMKMTAIVQRATRRDYVDLHAIFCTRSIGLGDAVSAMKQKFPGVDPSLALLALTYFNDVDKQPMPKMLARGTTLRLALCDSEIVRSIAADPRDSHSSVRRWSH